MCLPSASNRRAVFDDYRLAPIGFSKGQVRGDAPKVVGPAVQKSGFFLRRTRVEGEAVFFRVLLHLPQQGRKGVLCGPASG